MIAQLNLFAPSPAPHPGYFYVAGLRIQRGQHVAGAFVPGPTGWGSARLRDPAEYWPVSGHSPASIRVMWESQARHAGLDWDLFVKGWVRGLAGRDHWLDWPEGHVSMCLATLELNVAGARQQRAWSELTAWAAWRAAQPPAMKIRRAA